MKKLYCFIRIKHCFIRIKPNYFSEINIDTDARDMVVGSRQIIFLKK